eukprot:TRINITY_DN4710_c0_g1_i1.p1 TRINITY_DN4710_c0_g1~~TRINITY_DN4710_c0_g1_i1.p1  ORF type:complete len:228 (-),score=34.00 TRINITY_DN4710_c0_g1_i1:93-776(-)
MSQFKVSSEGLSSLFIVACTLLFFFLLRKLKGQIKLLFTIAFVLQLLNAALIFFKFSFGSFSFHIGSYNVNGDKLYLMAMSLNQSIGKGALIMGFIDCLRKYDFNKVFLFIFLIVSMIFGVPDLLYNSSHFSVIYQLCLTIFALLKSVQQALRKNSNSKNVGMMAVLCSMTLLIAFGGHFYFKRLNTPTISPQTWLNYTSGISMLLIAQVALLVREAKLIEKRNKGH